jgi:hypothetical protein
MPLSALFLLIAASLLVPITSAETVERRNVPINIEKYEVQEIEFSSGDRITIALELRSYSYPVSVLLFKGDEDYDEFVRTDEVDIEAIKNGEDVDLENVSYRVVGGFSARNVTEYDHSISLSEHDTYYVVIILYRDEDMSYQEILTTRATTVDYVLEYETDSKNVPYYLIPVAVILFIIGIVLIVYYFRARKKAEESLDEEYPRYGDRRRDNPFKTERR